MKAMKTILAVMAAAALATAQTPSTSKPKAPASQMVSGAPAKAPSAAPAKMPAQKHQAAQKHAAPASTPMHPRAKKPVVNAVAKPSAAVPKKPAEPKAAGKRDPFVSPVVRAAAGGTGSMCSTGKRCLAIAEVVLRGIVKTQSGMIAVVSNQANRAYFLKENDPVFNGTVLKITADSVVFRENVLDNLGRETTREIVKRVSAPPV